MEVLLRVPGVGVKSAQRIVAARRSASLSFRDLKKIGVVLKAEEAGPRAEPEDSCPR